MSPPAPPPAPTTFTTLPILPLRSALSPATKPAFLDALRDALLNVGFLYLSETGLPDELVDAVVRECRLFFEALPLCEKEAVEMKREKSFLGWSRVSLRVFFLFCSLLSLVWVGEVCEGERVWGEGEGEVKGKEWEQQCEGGRD
jgi:hypothetical protein